MNIKPLFRRLFDNKVKVLVKSGFLSEDLKWTTRGREALRAIQLVKFETELLEMAQEYIDEAKED